MQKGGYMNRFGILPSRLVEELQANYTNIVAYYFAQHLTPFKQQKLGMSRHLKKEFQRLENMQAAIFQQMQRYQNQTMKELCDRQQLKKRQQQRMLQIKKKAPKELVTNPHNNGVWVELANFLDEQQFIDLSEIEQRKRERELIRAQMDRKRAAVQAVGVIQHQTLSWKQLDKNQEVVAKVPWKLMRELRRKEVAENKARFERIEQNKRDKVSHYHKY